MNSKRTYPRKSEDERRIVVSFSLSRDQLKAMRAKLQAYDHGAPPTPQAIQSFSRGLAYSAIEEYLSRPVVLDDEE